MLFNRFLQRDRQSLLLILVLAQVGDVQLQQRPSLHHPVPELEEQRYTAGMRRGGGSGRPEGSNSSHVRGRSLRVPVEELQFLPHGVHSNKPPHVCCCSQSPLLLKLLCDLDAAPLKHVQALRDELPVGLGAHRLAVHDLEARPAQAERGFEEGEGGAEEGGVGVGAEVPGIDERVLLASDGEEAGEVLPEAEADERIELVVSEQHVVGRLQLLDQPSFQQQRVPLSSWRQDVLHVSRMFQHRLDPGGQPPPLPVALPQVGSHSRPQPLRLADVQRASIS
eukprot:656296-Hanusia_phi.AAC.2